MELNETTTVNPVFRVTRLSKMLSLLLFTILPIVFLYIGYVWAESQAGERDAYQPAPRIYHYAQPPQEVLPGLTVHRFRPNSPDFFIESRSKRHPNTSLYYLYLDWPESNFIYLGKFSEVRWASWGALMKNSEVLKVVYLNDAFPYGGIIASSSDITNFEWNDEWSVNICRGDGCIITPVDTTSFEEIK